MTLHDAEARDGSKILEEVWGILVSRNAGRFPELDSRGTPVIVGEEGIGQLIYSKVGVVEIGGRDRVLAYSDTVHSSLREPFDADLMAIDLTEDFGQPWGEDFGRSLKRKIAKQGAYFQHSLFSVLESGRIFANPHSKYFERAKSVDFSRDRRLIERRGMYPDKKINFFRIGYMPRLMITLSDVIEEILAE